MNSTSKRRGFLVVALCLVATFVATACGGGAPATATPKAQGGSTPGVTPRATTPPAIGTTPTPMSTPTQVVSLTMPTFFLAHPETALEPPTGAVGWLPPEDLKALPKRGGTFRFLEVAGANLDPFFPPHVANFRGNVRMYGSGLAEWDMKTNGPIPDVAESWKLAPDGRDWIFRIRPGIRFHNKAPVNGRELTVQDVKYSLDRISGLVRRPGDVSIHYSRFGTLQEVKIIDSRTVQLVLKQPDNQMAFELMNDYTIILPPEAANKDGNFSDENTLIGTGPFLVEHMVSGGLSTFVRNPDYFRAGPEKKPYIDKIEGATLDAAAALAAWRSGQLDMRAASGGAVLPYASLPNTRINYGLGALVGTSGVHMSIVNAPMTDVRIRRAINLAIDRDEVIAVLQDKQSYRYGPIGGWWEPWFWGKEKVEALDGMAPSSQKAPDYAKAKQLLAEAGFANGLTITCQCETQASAELLQSQLARVGITLKLNMGTSANIRTAAFMKDKQLSVTSTGGGTTPDFAILQDFLCNGANHPSGVCDPQIEQLWKDYRSSFDVKIMVQKLDQIQQTVWGLMIYAPTGARGTENNVVRTDVRMWRHPFYKIVAVTGNQMPNIWLDR